MSRQKTAADRPTSKEPRGAFSPRRCASNESRSASSLERCASEQPARRAKNAAPAQELRSANIEFFEDRADPHTHVGVVSFISPKSTVADAAFQYLQHLRLENAVSGAHQTSIHNKEWSFRFLGKFGDVALGELTRSRVQLWADSLAHVKGSAKAALSSLRYVAMVCFSALMTWCADRHDDLAGLPLLTRKRKMRAPINLRRILNWPELQSLRATLAYYDAHPEMTRVPQDMVRLLRVLCNDGARMCEVRRLRAADVDLQKGAIILRRGKNGKPRVIVLSRVSLTIIQAQMELRGDGFLFSSPRTERPFLHTSASRQLGRMARAAGIRRPEQVTCHTPRRSVADCAHQAGGSIEEIALMLGNTPDVLRKHYLSTAISPGARRINDLVNPESA